MYNLGEYNEMTLVKKEAMGWFLDGGKLGNVLLPNRVVPKNCKLGDTLQVFLYLDSEDRLIATTLPPLATVGELAYLEVGAVNDVGAFMKWGLDKDLLVPFSEQKEPMQAGQSHLVYLYLDKSNRIVASERLNRFFKEEAHPFQFNDRVNITVYGPTDLGMKVVVENRYWGVIHGADLNKPLDMGQKLDAYIKHPRPDGKLDISLISMGYGKTDDLSVLILEKLAQADGYIAISDKSGAEEIKAYFGVSKRVFKMALGKLYKERKITIEKQGIRLN